MKLKHISPLSFSLRSCSEVIRSVHRADASHLTVILLDKPYYPAVNDPDAKLETIGEGDDKVNVNGKEYETHWLQ